MFSGLTARETLQLYGSLKGICLSDLMTEVRQWLSALGTRGFNSSSIDVRLTCLFAINVQV